MIRWALFSTLEAGVFYLCYRLLFRRDHWLGLSRAYLMGTLMFSLLMPLVRVPATDLGEFRTITLAPIVVEQTAVATGMPTVGGVHLYLPTVLYLAGAIVAFAVLVFSVVRTLAQLRRMPTRHVGRLRLHLTDDDSEPCSFLSHIVIGARGLGASELHCVLAHEGAHVRMGHTVDVLAARLMCCAAWFNPFAWLMLSELRAVHEYQADATVLDHCGREGYMGLLYRQATGSGYGHITNNFHSINIKKRITMMKRKKSRFGAWKLVAVLPVAALLTMVGSRPAAAQVKVSVPSYGTSNVSFTVEETADSLPVTPQNAVVKVSSKSLMMTSSGSNGGPTVDTKTSDTDPEYPGGMMELYRYVLENLHYPEQAKADGVQGRVFVRFVIEADGTVTDAEVLRGIGGGCDEEALRVVQGMPKWKPGTVDGKPVRTQYNLPITFKLGDK